MAYFNYHATAKRLISEDKLLYYYYIEKHNNIAPALVLIFNDVKHHTMPIRQERWQEYLEILPSNKLKIKSEL